MPHEIALCFQVSLEFLFAYNERTIFRHAYSADYINQRQSEGDTSSEGQYGNADYHTHLPDDVSPRDVPSRSRIDNALLNYLSLLLSGYDLASETWANNTYEKQRTVFNLLTTTTTKAYNNITSRPECWSLKFGSGIPGPEVQGFQHVIDTPFANPGEMHACCVELTSPIFDPTNEEWEYFATGLNRMFARLQQPGILHSRPRMPSTHRHLAWTNESCNFCVSVFPRSEKHHVSWAALQNLSVVWETCAEEIERLTYQQQQSSYSSPQPPPRNESYLEDFAEALYDITTLQTYTRLLSSPALSSPQHLPSINDKISLLTDRSRTYCTSLRFHQHPSTLYLPTILFWTRFTYTAVLKCQSLAVLNRRIEVGSGKGWLDLIRV
ncbi:MAG: hypothetical protein Q9178_005640 [Gyalolechia marmorata]